MMGQEIFFKYNFDNRPKRQLLYVKFMDAACE